MNLPFTKVRTRIQFLVLNFVLCTFQNERTSNTFILLKLLKLNRQNYVWNLMKLHTQNCEINDEMIESYILYSSLPEVTVANNVPVATTCY
jgi:hypothetical protein